MLKHHILTFLGINTKIAPFHSAVPFEVTVEYIKFQFWRAEIEINLKLFVLYLFRHSKFYNFYPTCNEEEHKKNRKLFLPIYRTDSVSWIWSRKESIPVLSM